MREKGMTTITLKKINRDKVYQYIYQQKETSKLQIVQDLQMGLSTVSQNLNELEADGLISRNGYFESTGGRKAQIIRIVDDFRISIGVGILKDMFHMVAVNLYGDAIATETVELPYENSDDYYNVLSENIERFIKKQNYDTEKIEGRSEHCQTADDSRVPDWQQPWNHVPDDTDKAAALKNQKVSSVYFP